MLCLTAAGRRVGQIRLNRNIKGEETFAVLEGGVFGLMGLLIALTFSVSSSRLETRRQMIVDEANAIGTAWLRVALLPEAKQGAMRQHFRQYVEIRLAFQRDITNSDAATRAVELTNRLQGEIWSQAVADCAETPSPATTILLLPALNSMIDLSTSGTMMAKNHLPWVIRALLVLAPLLCAFMAGIESAPRAQRVWIPSILFALLLSLTVYVVLDLDYPRAGLIRINAVDQALLELQTSMGSEARHP
jgi:hypothetical protein